MHRFDKDTFIFYFLLIIACYIGNVLRKPRQNVLAMTICH